MKSASLPLAVLAASILTALPLAGCGGSTPAAVAPTQPPTTPPTQTQPQTPIAFTRYLATVAGSPVDLPNFPAYTRPPCSGFVSDPCPSGSANGWDKGLTMSQTAVEYTPTTTGSYPWQNGQPWYFIFIHGNGNGTYGTGIGLFAAPVSGFSGSIANYQQPASGNPIFTQANSFDPSTTVTNIGSTVWTDPQDHNKKAIFLIYENNAADGKNPPCASGGGGGGSAKIGNNSLGIAISRDGVNFDSVTLSGSNQLTDNLNVSTGGTCVETGYGEPAPIVGPDGNLYVFVRHQQTYTGATGNAETTVGAYSYFKVSMNSANGTMTLDTSMLGTDFFVPSGYFNTSGNMTQAFDEYAISSLRLFSENGSFYLIYGGANQATLAGKYSNGNCSDYPEGMGLAKFTGSTFPGAIGDWTRYGGNPILSRGPAEGWADGAVWSATMLYDTASSTYYLWYMTNGSGSNDAGVSNNGRDQCYGGFGADVLPQYSSTLFLQVGLSTFTPPAGQTISSLFNTPLASPFPTSGDEFTLSSGGSCLQMSASSPYQVASGTCTSGNKNQIWTFNKNPDGTFQIVNNGLSSTNVVSGSSMDGLIGTTVPAGYWNLSGQTPLTYQPPLGLTTTQEWMVIPDGTNYQIINRDTNYSLTQSSSSVAQSPWLNQAGQGWTMTRVGP